MGPENEPSLKDMGIKDPLEPQISKTDTENAGHATYDSTGSYVLSPDTTQNDDLKKVEVKIHNPHELPGNKQQKWQIALCSPYYIS